MDGDGDGRGRMAQGWLRVVGAWMWAHMGGSGVVAVGRANRDQEGRVLLLGNGGKWVRPSGNDNRLVVSVL